MDIKEFNKTYNEWKIKYKYPRVPPSAVPLSKFSNNGANAITKAILALVEMIGGEGKRVNAAGVARGVKVKMAAYTDVLGDMHPAKMEPKYTSSGNKGEPDISANFLSKKGVAISVKIEVKYGRDTLKDHQEERLIKYMKAGCICMIAKNFDTVAQIILDLHNDNINQYKNRINLWQKKL